MDSIISSYMCICDKFFNSKLQKPVYFIDIDNIIDVNDKVMYFEIYSVFDNIEYDKI